MILVDTNIIIDYWKSPDEEKKRNERVKRGYPLETMKNGK